MENAIKKLLRELYEGLNLEEESKKIKTSILICENTKVNLQPEIYKAEL